MCLDPADLYGAFQVYTLVLLLHRRSRTLLHFANVGLGSLQCYQQLAFSVENRTIIWQSDVIIIIFFLSVENTFIFFGRCCQTLLLPSEKDEPLQCLKTLPPLANHFAKKCYDVSGLFPVLKQTGNFLVKHAAHLILLHENILILLKSEPKQVENNVALRSHGLQGLHCGLGGSFWTGDIKACSLWSGHGVCAFVKTQTAVAITEPSQ